MLIRADCFTFGQGSGFVCDAAVAQGNGCNTACMNDLLDAPIQGRLHDVASAINVGGKNFFRIRRPQTVVSGHVKNVAYACHRAFDRFTVAHIAFKKLDVQTNEGRVRVSFTD